MCNCSVTLQTVTQLRTHSSNGGGGRGSHSGMKARVVDPWEAFSVWAGQTFQNKSTCYPFPHGDFFANIEDRDQTAPVSDQGLLGLSIEI